MMALSGCAQMPSWNDMPSWLGGSSGAKSTVAHQPTPPQTPKTDIAPPPVAAPVAPVQAQTVAPLPGTTMAPMPAPAQVYGYGVKVKVGILLPLTGPNAGLGHAMLNAAQQAVYDAAAPNFELLPRDTGSNETQGAQAAREAIAAGAQVLVGPLFATQIPAVGKIASAAHVSVLTLSTDTTQASPGLYVMGFAPGGQVARVITFAIERGLKRFAALVPATPYGRVVGQAFQLEVAKNGGTVVALDSFDPVKNDLDAAVRDLADKSGVIDALFLPEGGSDLALVTKKLAGAGFDSQKTRMLGTGLWDAYDTGRVAPFVVDGWYAAPDPAVRQGFIAAYKATYNEEPPRLATLAYDATALAAALAKRGARFDTATLTNQNGFAGLDGIFRLKDHGEVERGLAVLQVTGDASEVADSSPPSFVGAKR